MQLLVRRNPVKY